MTRRGTYQRPRSIDPFYVIVYCAIGALLGLVVLAALVKTLGL